MALVDTRAVLAAFDEQIRRDPRPGPREQIERDDGTVRIIAPGGGWSGVVWSDPGLADVDTVIAAQVGRFAELGQPWEWKHYSYDRPQDLPQRLRAAGLAPDPVESLLVAEIAQLQRDEPPPSGVELVAIADEGDASALVRVHDEVFGGDHSGVGATILAGRAQRPSTVEAVIAMAGDTAVAAGRVELHVGTEFASLWGGGTLPAWRGRGVFRSLVAHRAALAAARGFRHLLVDATSDSRPILRRMGFVELATTTPYRLPAPRARQGQRSADERARTERTP